MYREELAFDEGRRLYSVAAVVLLRRGSPLLGQSPPAPTAESLKPVEMYVDTGSNISSITEEVAMRIGLNPAILPTARVGGLGGFSHQAVSTQIDLAVAGRMISLDKVSILSPFHEKVKSGKGVYKREGTMEHPPINLFGLDALAKLRARLIVVSDQRHGWLEID